jgi:very-short-patch-repair endonuclease
VKRINFTKKNSTKAERIFAGLPTELRIPFEHGVILDGREIDFLIFGNTCIEIDGHKQDSKKNTRLVELGYVPIHIENIEIKQDLNNIKTWLLILKTTKETFSQTQMEM